MGASNDNQFTRTFFKLKEDKVDGSETKGQYRFYKKEKTPAGWAETDRFSKVTGYLEKIYLKTYEFEGQTKEEIAFDFVDDEIPHDPFTVHLGFESMIAKSILNSLAGIADFGVISLSCGMPKERNGKVYPTLYVNHNGEKTDWAYRKEDVPQITTETDEDRNVIKRGVAANLEFWRKVIEEINPRLNASKSIVSGAGTAQPKPTTSSPSLDPDQQALHNAHQNFYQSTTPDATGTGNYYNPSPENADDLPF